MREAGDARAKEDPRRAAWPRPARRSRRRPGRERRTPAAPALNGEVVLACLDATEDPLGCEDAHVLLLSGFDGLSSLLERGGLPEEALAVVEDAASLGLLNGGDVTPSAPREALQERREGLRRILFADSAQL